jgi:hypothetical protein
LQPLRARESHGFSAAIRRELPQPTDKRLAGRGEIAALVVARDNIRAASNHRLERGG